MDALRAADRKTRQGRIQKKNEQRLGSPVLDQLQQGCPSGLPYWGKRARAPRLSASRQPSISNGGSHPSSHPASGAGGRWFPRWLASVPPSRARCRSTPARPVSAGAGAPRRPRPRPRALPHPPQIHAGAARSRGRSSTPARFRLELAAIEEIFRLELAASPSI
jgi:hypothetical protein